MTKSTIFNKIKSFVLKIKTPGEIKPQKIDIQKYFDDNIDFSKPYYCSSCGDCGISYVINSNAIEPIEINDFLGKKIKKIIETKIGPAVLFYIDDDVYIIHHVCEFSGDELELNVLNDFNVLLNKTIVLADMHTFKNKKGLFYRLGTDDGYCVFDMWNICGCEINMDQTNCYKVIPRFCEVFINEKTTKYAELE